MGSGQLKRNGRGRSERWLGLYTALFLCVAAALGAVMLRYGKTLVWNPDGVKQHYTVIGYVGRAVRDLLAGKGVPMMNFSLGQGMDVLTTCSYYGYTDPLSLLGALARGQQIEWIYILTDFLRLWLAGVFFGLYARKVGSRDGWATGCAAAIYVFGGYFARMLGRHPYFINGGLYLPLLLLGVERVLKGRRWLMFTLVTALMLIVNFYFAFMNTAVAVIYILVRLAFRLRERGVRRSAGDGFLLVGAYLLGAALSAVVFVPILRVYIANSRMGVKAGYSGSMLHYPLKWYREMFAYAFAPWDSPGNFLFMNFAPPALFALLALFAVRGRRARQMRIALYLCVAAACLPILGLLMNGGAYVSSRWSYSLALFAALGCAVGLPTLFKARSRCRKPVAIIAMAYAAALAAHCLVTGDHPKRQLVAPLCIAAFAVGLLIYDSGRAAWLTRKRARGLTALFLAGTCALYVLIGYLPMGYNNIREQESRGVYRRIAGRAGGQLIDDDGVFRVTQGLFDDANSMLLGYMGTSYYWSLVDGENSLYYTELNLPTQTTTYHLYGLGGSAAMNAVAGVKYFLQHDGDNYVVPYGYARGEEAIELPDGTTAAVYENGYALPLGYAFDQKLSRDAYEALPVEEKLRALVEYAIVDDAASGALPSVPSGAFERAAEDLAYTVGEQSDAALDGSALSGEAGGRVHLDFEAPGDSEVYLILEGLEIRSLERNEDGVLDVESEGGDASANVPHPNSNFYFPKRNYAFCLGTGSLKGCDIVFGNAMEYSCGSVRVACVPMDGYVAATQARQAEGLREIRLSNDRLTGRIEVSGARALQIALPYSAGWRAWVDGVEQPVFRCGGLYMGVALEAGAHEIEMRYVTPGLKAGAAISAAALLLTVALAVVSAVRRRRKGKANG